MFEMLHSGPSKALEAIVSSEDLVHCITHYVSKPHVHMFIHACPIQVPCGASKLISA
jgi:hypothetical protein